MSERITELTPVELVDSQRFYDTTLEALKTHGQFDRDGHYINRFGESPSVGEVEVTDYPVLFSNHYTSDPARDIQKENAKLLEAGRTFLRLTYINNDGTPDGYLAIHPGDLDEATMYGMMIGSCYPKKYSGDKPLVVHKVGKPDRPYELISSPTTHSTLSVIYRRLVTLSIAPS